MERTEPRLTDHARRRTWWTAAAGALCRHPGLWPTAIVQAWRLAPAGWWRRRPWLPVPDRAYLRFRLQTAYGDPEHDPEPGDVVTYLRWCRDMRHVAG